MTDAILLFMTEGGYLAVFFLMFVENVFPPIPSEVILPYVGHMASVGNLNLFWAIVVSSIGSLLGTSFWFVLGWLVPVERLKKFFRRYGAYVAITLKDFEKGVTFFKRHERATVFFARMIPAVRSVISVPAGSVRMSPVLFLLISGFGVLLWNTILILIGYTFLTDIYLVEKHISPVSDLVIYAFILAYLYKVVTFHLKREPE